MPRRIISTLALTVVTVLGIFIDFFFILFILLLTFGGLYEFFSMIQKKGISTYKYFGTAIGLIIPLSIFYRFEFTKGWELLFIVAALISLFVLQITKKGNTQAVLSISTTIFGLLYVSWLFSFLVRIKLLPDGAMFISAIILITKSSDIGALLIGTRWGKTALIPRISPNKSFEGLMGAIAFAVLAAFISKSFLPQSVFFSYGHLLLIGIVLGIIAQLGDISESLIKRDCVVKDSGKIIPGIGGVLDLIDSLLFTAPVFYLYVSKFLNKI